ncbi:hypothetical protein [Ideonella sp. YS5]|uniref:hypothetical protein n=1 Tax=Ideonella sp. YS5 TaxID=3453714 RepID=UPI003F6EDAC0
MEEGSAEVGREKLCGWRRACLASVLLLAALGGSPAVARSGIGLNLATWDYFSPDLPLVDQFKRSSGWLTQCEPSRDTRCQGFSGEASSWDTREEDRLELDAQGWVKRLPASDDPNVRFRSVGVLLFNGNGHAHPAGKYIVTYEGKGVLVHDLLGRKIDRESRPGRDVVEVSNQADGGWRIAIQATDPKDHLRNIRVFPPGGACAKDLDRYAATPAECEPKTQGAFVPFEKFPAERRWHPRFVQDLRGFRVLRFMDWGKTNSTRVTDWRERAQPDAAIWASDAGVPIEAMLDLSRVAGADPWLNLPMRASDDYVRGFAKLLRQQLPPGRVAIVEYANEPWNQAFPVAGWMHQRAQAQWPGAGRKVGGDVALANNWYAWRSVQICQMVKAEWGAQAAPVRCVVNTQAANPELIRQVLACPQAAAQIGKACAKGVDAVAIAPYFGGYLAEPSLRTAVVSWPKDPDGGLNRLFQELLAEDPQGARARPPLQGHKDAADAGALAQSAGWMRAAKAVADAHGLPMWAYEGGQHLTPPGGVEDPAWLKLIVAANRDRRMGRAYERHLSDWRSAGGQLFVWFNHLAVPSQAGAWGLKETQFSDDSTKWQAVRAQRDGLACWWPGCEQ